MKDLQLINQLSESKMFRTPKIVNTVKVDDAAELAFMHLLILTVFNHSYDFAPLASEYAKRTIAYGNFNRFRTNGTDLYIMFNRLTGEDQEYDNEKDKIAIQRIRLNYPRMKRFLTSIARNETSSTIDRELYRFEKDLNIQDSMLKSIRRLVGDWEGLSHSQKSVLVTRMKQFMTQRAQLSDLTQPILKFQKNEKLAVDDTKDRKKRVWNHPIVHAALAIAGPIAAYKVGSAIGKKMGKTSFTKRRNLGRLASTKLKK